MGLLTGLLLLPVTAPAKGFLFILNKIKEQADAEMLDEGLIQDQLMTLSLRHELGEISDDDYAVAEAALLERLNAVRAYKESLAEEEGIVEDEE